MILVIFVVCLVVFIIGSVLLGGYRHEGLGWGLSIPSAVIGVIALIVGIFLCCNCAGSSKVDERIDMYVEENAKIEQQIAECVNQYQQYEQETFDKVKPESAMTYITLYPELKSDTLVQKQIETYISNNEKIKSLKEEQINASISRWWLYFGK